MQKYLVGFPYHVDLFPLNLPLAFYFFVLPFVFYGVAYGFYCLGRSLARLVPVLWARLQRKEKGR